MPIHATISEFQVGRLLLPPQNLVLVPEVAYKWRSVRNLTRSVTNSPEDKRFVLRESLHVKMSTHQVFVFIEYFLCGCESSDPAFDKLLGELGNPAAD